jgi:CubicO group peptidase (beta-lactamase class C family)
VTDVGADFDPGITIPNGGWNAPAQELAAYVGFLTTGGGGVVKRATLEEMWRPVAPTGAKLPEFADAGLGFFSLEADDRRIVGHTGDQAGYRSYIYMEPAARSGIVLVFNTSNDTGAGEREMAELARAAIALLRP